MTVFLMAAGKGTRLAPFTNVVPKPAIPVANEPVMGRLLRLLARQGFQRVVANVSYKGELLEAMFGDGSVYGVQLRWSREGGEPLGNAGGMRYAEALLRDGDEPVLVLSGDGLHEVDLNALVREHRRSGALVTIALTRVDDTSEFGVAVLDAAGRIERFQEKPRPGTELSNLANIGIYVIEPAVFDLLPPSGEFHDFGGELFPGLLAEGHHLQGVEVEGYWNDVGSLRELHQANLDVVRGVLVHDRVEAAGAEQHLVHPTAELAAGVELSGTCVVGPGVRVGAGAHIADSVLLPEAVVPAGAMLSGAVLGDVDGLLAWAQRLGRGVEAASTR